MAEMVAQYKNHVSSRDEMWHEDGGVREHWRPLLQAIERSQLDTLLKNEREAERMIRNNGVTYNAHGASDAARRPWQLDILPLILNSADWQTIERGVQQRAELFDLILHDLYGQQRIIKEGIVPFELIYGHYGFIREAYGLQSRDSRSLITCAFDLARGPNGQMWVIADRVQTPSGMGYALENRTVMAQLSGDLIDQYGVRRLANFFRAYQKSIAGLADGQDDPSVAFLTPGPYNESYFEHAYLAAYLGYTLVQGADLQVRDGTVCLKTLSGLQPVDVLVRRVLDVYCDPLELREDSYIGVTGLMEAVRRGGVAMANPIGCAILENSGLIPFLPSLSQYFLSEPLILPSAATWWCGQATELNHVLENLDQLLIKRTDRSAFAPPMRPALMTAEEKAALRERIVAAPHNFVGQEDVSYSTVPSLVNGQFEPRSAFLRSFVVAGESDYEVMPGGLTLSVPDNHTLSNSPNLDNISKDTWVLADEPEPFVSLWSQRERIESSIRQSFYVSSRSAENLFWVGRYAERCEAIARLLRTVITRSRETDLTPAIVQPLLDALLTVTYTSIGEDDEPLEPVLQTLFDVALDVEQPGSLLSALESMSRAAYSARDLWSVDSWRALNRTEAISKEWHAESRQDARNSSAERQLSELIMLLMSFMGLNSENMTRTAGWLMLDIGRRIERSVLILDMLRSILVREENSADAELLESMLRTTENIITYRRRYRSWLHIAGVLDLLLVEEQNPRSLLFQVNRLQAHIDMLPHDQPHQHARQRHEQKLVLDIMTRIRLVDIAHLMERSENGTLEHLDEFCTQLKMLLWQISDALSQRYFTHTSQPRQLLHIPEME